MRVVLDTNVLVAGLITPRGTCGRIVDLFTDERIQPFVDTRILMEYERVLPRPRLKIDRSDVNGLLELIDLRAEVVTPSSLPDDLPDPTDRAFLEVAAHADAVLVTGNKRHFPVKARHGAMVLTPSEFLEYLRTSS
jgi:putative PIN family toxin of toxin-antitoxin system